MRYLNPYWARELDKGIRLRHLREGHFMFGPQRDFWNDPNERSDISTDRRRVEITLPKLKYLEPSD